MREFYDRIVHLPYKPGTSVGAYEDYIHKTNNDKIIAKIKSPFLHTHSIDPVK